MGQARRCFDSFLPLIALAALPIAGCGGDDNQANTGLQWGGSTPHLAMKGAIGGETIDLSLQGADAADLTKFFCYRKYEVNQLADGSLDYAQGKIVSGEFTVPSITVNGIVRTQLSMQLKMHDFQRDPVPSTIAIVPRVDTAPLPNQVYLDFQYDDASAVRVYEQSAQTGTMTLMEWSGTPDATGLVIPDNTGAFGATLSARWSTTDSLDVSFTANCGVGKVKVIVPATP